MINRRVTGDCREVLKSMAAEGVRVQCVVTSPPYWGLRDYGVDRQIGLEETPEEYIAEMVGVFRLVRDVLADDGVMWVNMGDSYASDIKGSGGKGGFVYSAKGNGGNAQAFDPRRLNHGLKPKDLVGMPWRLAFALQADGWWLRSDIIWSKPNPMPEPVQGSQMKRHRITIQDYRELQMVGLFTSEELDDLEESGDSLIDCPGCSKCNDYEGLIPSLGAGRPTKAHEYVFLLSKSASYFWDADAVRQPQNVAKTVAELARQRRIRVAGTLKTPDEVNSIYKLRGGEDYDPSAGRNLRTVWTIPSRPFKDAHFATFPPKLVEPCIMAGTSERGHCPECGARWVRVVERSGGTTGKSWHDHGNDLGAGMSQASRLSGTYRVETLGWRATCDCCFGETESGMHYNPVPDIVLDPFLGSGTVAQVAQDLGRSWIGIDLNQSYEPMQKRRTAQQAMIWV